MGQIPLAPRPQFDDETDEQYHAYLHGAYRDYLIVMREANPFSHIRIVDMALIIVVVTALTIVALQVLYSAGVR